MEQNSTNQKLDSRSVSLRQEGNDVIRSISETMPFFIKEPRLLQCLKLYRDSTREANTAKELSSSLKNISVVTFRLFEVHAAEGEGHRKLALFYAMETQRESTSAYHTGSQPGGQNKQWLAQLKAKQLAMAQAYLVDFVRSPKFYSDLEEQVDLMVKLKHESADHVKCWINYKIAEAYCHNSISRRDYDLPGSFRSVNESNYYFEECLRLQRHTNFKFDFNIQEFASSLAIEFCIVESLKYKQIVDTKIDLLLNRHEQLDMEAIWDCIDLYHEVICKSRDNFVELEAEVLSLLGTIYGKILKMKGRAKKYYASCYQLTEALKPKLFTKYKWYKECMSAIEAAQKEVVREEEKKEEAEKKKVVTKISKDLESIKKEFQNNDSRKFVQFIYKTYPPKNKNQCPSDLDKFLSNEFKKVVKKALVDYHEDKNSSKEYGFEW